MWVFLGLVGYFCFRLGYFLGVGCRWFLVSGGVLGIFLCVCCCVRMCYWLWLIGMYFRSWYCFWLVCWGSWWFVDVIVVLLGLVCIGGCVCGVVVRRMYLWIGVWIWLCGLDVYGLWIMFVVCVCSGFGRWWVFCCCSWWLVMVVWCVWLLLLVILVWWLMYCWFLWNVVFSLLVILVLS